MAKTIWKFDLRIDDHQYIRMPDGALILKIAVQHGQTCLWAEVDPENPMVDRKFFVAGTGHPLDPSPQRRHLETLLIGQFVWHVFEIDYLSPPTPLHRSSRRMKALTICQPYAELIARGVKRVENRVWDMKYRGPLLIHAGKNKKFLSGDNYGVALSAMDWGALIALVDVTDCLPIERIEAERKKTHTERTRMDFPSRLEFLLTHEHVEGPFCIVMANIRRLKQPIPYRGAMGLFDVPNEIWNPEPVATP